MSTASVAGVRVVSRSSISRTARRSTPCAASANAIARSATRSSLARAFRDELGLDELYVADLDAITGAGEQRRRDPCAGARGARHGRRGRQRAGAGAGAAGPRRAPRRRRDRDAGRTRTRSTGCSRPRPVLSVDLRDGRTLSPDPQLAGLPALDAVARLHRAGLREAIVLDLARVGSGAGPDVGLIAEIHAAFPELELLAGGGVRDADGPARARRRRRGRRARRDGAAPRRHRAARASLTTVSTCATSAAATSAPVASCSPCQPGIPLSSSTFRRRPQQVDARVVGAQRLGGLHAQALLLGAQLRRPRACAPRARFARHPAPTRSIAASTRPPTTNARRSRSARQRLLQVVDGALERQRVEDAVRDVGVVHARHPGAHRAEQRLDDHVAAELVEGLERVLGALAGDRPRRRHPGPGQQRRGEELVDRPLDRARAVDARSRRARRARAARRRGRSPARASRAGCRGRSRRRSRRATRAAHRDVAVDAPDHARHGHEPMLVAARRERVGQLLRVPAAARPQDRDGQPQNERSSTSRLTRPASKLRPLPTLVSLICAGLKSSGSIA